ncbi:hypothetical protein [Myroides odoratimimus]|uniref:hypothetical protein n=1 Tax=Myroides odoratimimus TaxID=76832 RepID=UPI002575F29C|nr:hypothetical protein [Myroides odoratimimus]MDM1452211.1 hypothetical protein [Myroides odoratimimus]MDM1475450.1 hypothetical protein [Myroides odoratimimus]MEC4083530.1 hypothetical protein [Myroides odoratimimus]
MNNKYTHEDFKAMKKALKITNADIAEITGLSKGNVDNTTKASAEDLPAWIKSMIYVWNKLK